MKVLHFADVHLGMSNFGRLDTATGLHTRVLEFLDAMDYMIDTAEEEQVDLVLFAGDAYRTRSPTPTLVKLFSERIIRLANICPVVMLVGNHDMQRGGDEKKHSTSISSNLSALHNIYVLDEICCTEMDECCIVSLPWVYDPDIDTVVDALDDALAASNDDKPCILLGHCTVQGASTGSYEFGADLGKSIVYPISLFEECFDYVALGHIHKHQNVGKNIVYSGSIERVDWGERDDDKGFVIADIDMERTKWKFVSAMPVPMLNIELEYKDIKKLRNIDVEDAIVRVVINMSRDGIPNSTVRAKVMDYLGTNYHILDALNISTPRIVRAQAASGLSSMSTMDLLESYFENAGLLDARIDELLDAAEDIINEDID